MKVATWNVNSLTVRLPHILEWAKTTQPDILAMQEIKLLTEVFPLDRFTEAGYHGIASGQKTYNGVATVSRALPADPLTDIPDFEDPARRVLTATIDGVRVVNVYVPNGQRVGSPKYEYKLGWLAAMRDYLAAEMSVHDYVVVLGDFNIAPGDPDVYDPVAWGDDIHCSPAERAALGEILKLGFVDTFRQFEQPKKSFSWWDYRAGKFRRNAGLRIDLILASAALASRCTASYIDRVPRGWERPSDHAPVTAEFAL